MGGSADILPELSMITGAGPIGGLLVNLLLGTAEEPELATWKRRKKFSLMFKLTTRWRTVSKILSCLFF